MKKSNFIPFFKNKEQHPFHIVDRSLLPIGTSQSVFMLILAILNYFHPNFITTMPNAWVLYSCSLFFFTISLLSGFIQIVIESAEGHHTSAVRRGLRLGMIFFIISEVMFFFAFFWAFFHVSLSPSIAIGCVWPPKGIQPLDIGGLPLVNTLLLLSSGVTITLAHRAILKANNFIEHFKFQAHLFATIAFGITFLCCQGIEYKYGLTFTGKENVYGSTFFVTTGFHGLHVIIGTLFLLFCLVRSILTLLRIPRRIDLVRAVPAYSKRNLFLIQNLRPGYYGKYGISTRTYIPLGHINHFNLGVYDMFSQLFIQLHNIHFILLIFPIARLDITFKRAFQKAKKREKLYQEHNTFEYGLLLKGAGYTMHYTLAAFIVYRNAGSIYGGMNKKGPKYGFTKYQHLGFEAAAGYGHFVDVVGLFLFISIYGGGS